ncbi:MAG TPA: class I adenylate-forming enzyme family protein [Acidimicrobiia bacterium]|nr:class I adenylate-forming enzyme family protein [Acidimicrobiia bacterium]
MKALIDLLLEPGPDALPADVVVHDADGTTTRAALTESALEVRDALARAGVARGTAVAVMLGNRAETIAALFGVWALGAVYVPVNPRLTDREITLLLDAITPAALITTASAAQRFPQREMTSAAGFAIGVASGPARAHDPDVALVQTTSGTTGPPRPVPLRHSQVLALLDGVITTFRTATASDAAGPPMANLVPVSLSLWAGIYTVCFAFRVGAPVVLMDHFDPNELARLVAEHQIRSVVLPPAAMAMCCDEPRLTSLAPLRYVRSITAPLSPFLARRFVDRFGVAVLNGYGQTELGGEVIGWNAADWREFGETKLGAVGRPHAHVEVRIDDGGELWVRTPSSASSASLGDRLDAEGWLRTGDHARIDDDGFVWIEGRVSDVINRGGLKVFPADVEEVLATATGVREVAVVGIEDARLGEVPVAFVAGTIDQELLEAHCREHLAPYKIPTRFVEVASLPRNEVGKVLRAELAQSAMS